MVPGELFKDYLILLDMVAFFSSLNGDLVLFTFGDTKTDAL
jgi:hypothetical protein